MKAFSSADRLGKEAILPLLLKLSVPSIIGMLIQALYNVVDSIYLGHLSKEALSALSLAFPIQMILIAIGAGTGISVSSLISRLLGKKEHNKAKQVAEHLLPIILIYGFIVGISGFFFSTDLMSFFTSDFYLISLGERYISIVMMGSVVLFSSMILNNLLRGQGNTFMPMLALILGAVINIILDPFLIFGIGFFPKMGIEGAAYATVFSRMLSAAFLVIIIFSRKSYLKIGIKSLKFDIWILKNLYQIAFPAMLMHILSSIMIAGINFIVAAYGTTAIAVTGIYFRLQSFILMPVIGLNQGFMPIVGYNFGHKNYDRLKKTIFHGLLIGICFTSFGFLCFQLFSKELIAMFNPDEKLLSLGALALKRISWAFPFMGFSIVGSTTFQALGKGFPSLLISLLRQIFLLLPIMYLLSTIFGLKNIWYAFPVAEVVSATVLAFWLYFFLKTVWDKS